MTIWSKISWAWSGRLEFLSRNKPNVIEERSSQPSGWAGGISCIQSDWHKSHLIIHTIHKFSCIWWRVMRPSPSAHEALPVCAEKSRSSQGCLLLVLSGLLWCLLAHTLVNCCNSSTDNILQNKRHGHRVLRSLLPPVCSRRMPTLVLGDPALGALRVHRRYDCGI